MTGPEKGLRIEARGLVKRYPGVLALNHADLTLEAGSIHGLLGKNGAGKSTIIKVLAGVIQPDEGEIKVDGEVTEVHNPHAAGALGFSFAHQELTDVPNLTVAENVLLGLGYPTAGGAFVRRREMRRRAAAVLDRLDAGIDPGAPLTGLSIAQRRLVVIARGLAADARLFVLDEPTASLTDAEIEHLDKTLKTLRDEGVAILYVSHRLEEIFAMTDTVTVMLDGAAVHHGKTADLDKSKLIELITGTAPAVEKRTPHSTPAGAPTLLEARGVTVPGTVNDVSFELKEGEMLGLAGLVGAGRTELMRAIFGADRAASGEILMRGKAVKIRSPRDGLGAGIVLLPEDRKHEGGILDFSVRKNMTLPSLSKFRRGGAPVPNERRERKAARELVERLHIKVSDVEYPTRFLSGGNQQKVVLAKWLDSGADVFIFDEPTQGIDVEGKEEVYQLMTALADEGKGVIFVSSEFNELIGTCSRILVMREGELVGQFDGMDISEGELVDACYSHEAEPLAAS